MRFVLLTIGKSKFDFVENGVAHYAKNIRHKTELEIELLRDCDSDADKEAEAMFTWLERKKFLNDGKNRIVLLDEGGKEMGSVDFSEWIQKLEVDGVSRIIFIIGGAYGFGKKMKEEALKISLSKMTFPHDFARVVLLEQIYRALHIQAGSKYHHV